MVAARKALDGLWKSRSKLGLVRYILLFFTLHICCLGFTGIVWNIFFKNSY